MDPRCQHHFFDDADEEEAVSSLRSSLLCWYDDHKRVLPWRTKAEEEEDEDVRGYAVWVSEVMLQQTQVATVVDYYRRWMERWPNTRALAAATLEEVHQVWSGLGYYSRGKRLWEGAKLVEESLRGKMPRTSASLEELPGVGRYTACAVASIAFQERVGLVDGNVARVVSRMRCIGADQASKMVTEALWKNANCLVDSKRPGDFNQAVMELGAIICTPKNPSCSSCPVSDHCQAFLRVQKTKDENRRTLSNVKSDIDVEDLTKCDLCLPSDAKYQSEEGVTNYPRKSKKAPVRLQTSIVVLISNASSEFLLLQRPKTGLLANLLEFPSFLMPDENSTVTTKEVCRLLEKELNIKVPSSTLESRGDVIHQFSHIKQTYVVYNLPLNKEVDASYDKEKYQKLIWLSAEDIGGSAISTAMKKVFQKGQDNLAKRKAGAAVEKSGKRKTQKEITSFFTTKAK